MTTAAPVASVIVALNPHDNDLRRIFAACDAQQGIAAPYEVLVIDNGARAGVAAACREHAAAHPGTAVVHVACDRRGRAAANNAGIRRARAGHLVFVADDFIPAPTLLRAHLDFQQQLAAPAAGIGPAYFTPACARDPFRRWLEDSGRLFGVPFRTASVQWPGQFFYVGNVSLPRSAFDRVGGFDERFEDDLQDDLEFGLRLAAAGIRTHLLPAAVAWHDHDLTLDERLEAMRRAGRAARRMEARAAGARPWAPIVDQPVAPLAALAAVDRATDPSAQARAEYFRARVDLAFIEGYRAGDPAPP